MKNAVHILKIALPALAALIASCASGGESYSRSGTIPEEWIREAWVSEGGRQSLDAWLKPGPWIQRELFPCHICYSFHGDVAVTNGPAHMVPDNRETMMCPHCSAVGRLPCRTCDGKGGTVCDVCEGFGILRCNDPKCRIARVADTVEAKSDWFMVEKKSAHFEDSSYMAPSHEFAKTVERGEIRYTSLNPCPVCKSKGFMDCPFCRNGICPCPDCKGTGLEKGPCPRCHGERWILPPDLQGRTERVRTRQPAKQ